MPAYWQKRLELLKNQAKRRHVPDVLIAVAAAKAGDTDQAFKWLQKAFQDHDQYLIGVKVLPQIENLRSDPRYADLLRRMGLPP